MLDMQEICSGTSKLGGGHCPQPAETLPQQLSSRNVTECY